MNTAKSGFRRTGGICTPKARGAGFKRSTSGKFGIHTLGGIVKSNCVTGKGYVEDQVGDRKRR